MIKVLKKISQTAAYVFLPSAQAIKKCEKNKAEHMFSVRNLNLLISLSLWLCSSIGLTMYGEHALTTLERSASGLGCGMAPVFAFIWMERYVVVTNRIGALCSVAGMAAFVVSPVIIGSFIVDRPMTFAYVILGIVSLSIAVFGVAWICLA